MSRWGSQIVSVAALVMVASEAVFGQQRVNEENAILEAVIVAARAGGDEFTCLVVFQGTVDNYTDPSAELLRRLKNKNLVVYFGEAESCRNLSYVLWVGPILVEGPRRARVHAGRFLPSISGRPTYVLRKNWLGRWRVEKVLGME